VSAVVWSFEALLSRDNGLNFSIEVVAKSPSRYRNGVGI
jgi:hypothetical protein